MLCSVMMFPGTRSEWFDGYPRFDYETGGRSVTVIAPSNPLPGRFWAWKGEFLNAFPGTELELLRRGVYIAYLSYPDQFGSPAAVAAWDALYAELTGTYRFARKPALIGLSRGGLYCYAWAVMHPEKAACIFGDAPVCDVRSWPGGKGAGTGSPDEWRRFLEVFGYASEEEAVAFTGNPIDNLAPPRPGTGSHPARVRRRRRCRAVGREHRGAVRTLPCPRR